MVDKLHGVARKIVDLIRQVILVGFAFIMIKAGGALVFKQLQAGQTTPVMKLPMSLMYFSLVLASDLSSSFRPLRWYSRLQNSERKRETGHECRIDFIFDFQVPTATTKIFIRIFMSKAWDSLYNHIYLSQLWNKNYN